jgi:hypothetical protein
MESEIYRKNALVSLEPYDDDDDARDFDDASDRVRVDLCSQQPAIAGCWLGV